MCIVGAPYSTAWAMLAAHPPPMPPPQVRTEDECEAALAAALAASHRTVLIECMIHPSDCLEQVGGPAGAEGPCHCRTVCQVRPKSFPPRHPQPAPSPTNHTHTHSGGADDGEAHGKHECQRHGLSGGSLPPEDPAAWRRPSRGRQGCSVCLECRAFVGESRGTRWMLQVPVCCRGLPGDVPRERGGFLPRGRVLLPILRLQPIACTQECCRSATILARTARHHT